jgi:glucokinase
LADVRVLGIEIGGTKLQLGIGQGTGTLTALDRIRVDPSGGAQGILAQIESALPALLHKASLSQPQLAAAGIGFGGPVLAAEGRTQTSYQVTGWDDFPLAVWVRERLGVPRVILENDADCAGLAEARFGAGAGYSPVLYVNVGSGIGGSLIIDGRIYRASGRGAMEIGHLRVPDDTVAGCCTSELEKVASGWAIAASAQELARSMVNEGDGDWDVLRRAGGDPSEITAILVAQAAHAGDVRAAGILDRARKAVASGLATAITLLAPRRIVLGGGVSLVGETGWLGPIRSLVNRDVFASFRGSFDIVPAALGEEVVVHGALALARESLSSPR